MSPTPQRVTCGECGHTRTIHYYPKFPHLDLEKGELVTRYELDLDPGCPNCPYVGACSRLLLQMKTRTTAVPAANPVPREAAGPRTPLPNSIEPTLLERLDETQKFLSEAEIAVSVIKANLFAESSAEPGQNVASCAESMTANICTRLASLVGELRTIQERIVIKDRVAQERPSCR